MNKPADHEQAPSNDEEAAGDRTTPQLIPKKRAIRERVLAELDKGHVTSVTLLSLNGKYYFEVELSWKPGRFIVTGWATYEPKTYTSIERALRHIAEVYRYTGRTIIEPVTSIEL